MYSSNAFDRMCAFCCKEGYGRYIEDEYHVIFDCPLYVKIRCELFRSLAAAGALFESIEALDSLSILSYLFTLDDACCVRTLSRHLCHFLALRSLFLNENHVYSWASTISEDVRLELKGSLTSLPRSPPTVVAAQLCLDLFGIKLPTPVPLLFLVEFMALGNQGLESAFNSYPLVGT